MTMPNRTSRKIVVNNESYRWSVSPHLGGIVFVVEREAFKGRILKVYINSDINEMWVSFPYIQNLNLKVIKPKDVELIISQSLNKGWNPKEKGAPIVFDLVEDCKLEKGEE